MWISEAINSYIDVMNPKHAPVLAMIALCCFSFLSRPVFGQESYRVEEGRIWVRETGKERAIGDLARDDDSLWGFDWIWSVSPDGDAVLYVSPATRGYRFHFHELGLSKPMLIQAVGMVSWRSLPAWSPDSRFAAISVGNRIWLFDRESKTTSAIASADPWIEDIDPSFSPDGRYLYFYRGETVEFSFSGSLFALELSNGELTREIEEAPRYPGIETNTAVSTRYSEYDFVYDIIHEKADRFAEDLIEGDYYALYLAFDSSYSRDQLQFRNAWPGPLTKELMNEFLFNGAFMYADYAKTIRSLDEIEAVTEYFVDDLAESVTFTVRLVDDSVVVFSIFWNFDTYLFFGAAG